MRKLVLFVALLLNASAAAGGYQTSVPVEPRPESTQERMRRERNNQAAAENLRNASNRMRRSASRDAADGENPVFRKPTRKDLLLVAPEAEYRAKYAEFLGQPKTGLTRLLSDVGCQERAALVVASEFCLKYQNLFGGSAFSFRTENYTLGRFADVAYKSGRLYTVGKLTLGFLAELGDVPLETLAAETGGVRFVFDFQPPENLPEIETAAARFQKGVEDRGFRYRKFFELRENHTYILRSVAYRKPQRVENNRVIYDELSDDKRKDVIIAFRIVKIPDAEKSNVIFLWKVLQSRRAPKISVAKK